MNAGRILRGLLSGILAAALVLPVWGFPVNANEGTEETAAPTETAETTAPPETTAPTDTVETTVPPEPEETTVPPQTEETTAPTETAVVTEPPTETEPPAPTVQETVPQETGIPMTRQTLVTVAFAKEMAEGTEGIAVQGTVVCVHGDLVVLQDRTGGIRLSFPEGETAAPGEVLLVTGSRSAEGIAVDTSVRKGTADLPAEETTLDRITECTRILIKNATFRSGSLLQGAASVSMTPANPEGVAPSAMVDAWGVVVDGWFYADRVVPVAAETEQTAVVTATPLDGILVPGENIGLHCAAEGTSIFYALSYDGETYSGYTLYSGGIPVEAETQSVYVRAYAVKEGGDPSSETEFYFSAAGSPEETAGWNLYFGLLHAHTALSDGLGSVEEAFHYAAGVEGLDFFAVTDHSNSFDNADSGAIGAEGTRLSTDWAAGKAAAAEVTGEDFVGIFGYEMTWQEERQLGHINTFNTPGWQSRNQEGFSTLESYYEALTTVPGSISQFNHPGVAYGYFENFTHYTPKYDAFIHLLEVGSEDGYSAYDYYTRALDAGWHVAPTNNQANHEKLWGDASSVRTVVLAQSLTEESLYDAMRSYRVYATEDSDLEILYYLDGNLMGSIVHTPAQVITVSLLDPTDAAIGTVEVVVDGGEVIAERLVESASQTLTIPVSDVYSYYYLRVTQPDGDIAVTAPVWVDRYVDLGIGSFRAEPEEPVQGQQTELIVELYNNENVDFILDTLEFFLDGQVIHRAETPITVPALDTFVYRFPFTYNGLGTVELRAAAAGTVAGVQQTCNAALPLRFQTPVTDLPLSAIAYARSGEAGEVHRVKGYVTAGTSNPNTTFPEMLYLQDNTGGIAVVDFTDSGIQVGAPLEVTGCLSLQEGNPVLQLLSYEVLDGDYYRYVPETMYHSTAMDFDAYGGQLLQVEGQVVSLTRTADGKGVSRFTLKDIRGDLATVQIDDAILSGADGVNDLYSQVKTGRTVRAMGILHREADGTLVLRVRNCDEVVYVPAVADPSNPKTGDAVLMPAAVLCVSALGLFRKRRR